MSSILAYTSHRFSYFLRFEQKSHNSTQKLLLLPMCYQIVNFSLLTCFYHPPLPLSPPPALPFISSLSTPTCLPLHNNSDSLVISNKNSRNKLCKQMIYILIRQHFCNCCIFYATKVVIFGISRKRFDTCGHVQALRLSEYDERFWNRL